VTLPHWDWIGTIVFGLLFGFGFAVGSSIASFLIGLVRK
jgi:hypothetical protein